MNDIIKVIKINDRVYLLDEAGQATGYLIVGDKQAAVVDTMNGEGNLLEIVIDRIGDQMPAQLIGEYQIHGILP